MEEGSDLNHKAPPKAATSRDESNQLDSHHQLNKEDSSTKVVANTSQHPSSNQHHHVHHQNSTETSYYAPPHQRQRWGDTQLAPHTNWGDLFFDVFYVAAAYNLGNMLKDTPSKEGLLYTAGVFFPIMNIWSFKVYYDSRFYYVNDYYHRIYEIFFLSTIATMILHIRSYEVLSHPNLYPDMFIFCLSVTVAFTLALGRYVEIIICFKYFERHSSGLHIEAYYSALRDLYGHVAAHLCIVAATIYSGIQFFHGASRVKADNSYTSNNASLYNETNYAIISQGDDSHHRFLAESDAPAVSTYSSNPPDNIPIWLLLGAVAASCAWFIVVVIYYMLNKEKKQSVSVPVNIEFMIRRYGEWVMLMLGEGVLSLLLVDIVQSSDYYVTFIAGLISIVLLQYLHYQSQPSDPNLHAYRRSAVSAFLYYWLMQVYSLALIVFGACYKMLLYEFVYQSYSESSYDRNRSRGLIFNVLNHRSRLLAEVSDKTMLISQLSTDERQQRVAHFFSGSLSLIFFCLDALSLAHRGIGEQWKRCKECEGTKLQKFLCWFLVLCRFLTIVFVASLSQFVTDPTHTSLIGVTVVVTQLCIRFVGYYSFHSASDVEERALERIIQYNTARILDHPHPHVTQ